MVIYRLILVILFSFSSGVFAQHSNKMDLVNGSCEAWNPGYEASCETCPQKVCPDGKKKCAKSELKCVGIQNCNTWAKGVCRSWKSWCSRYVYKDKNQGEGFKKEFRHEVQQCRLFKAGSLHFQTNLTESSVTPSSNVGVTADPTNPEVTGPGKHMSGTTGVVNGAPGYENFGDFCERSKEWCTEPTTADQLSNMVAKKELKKFLYSKGVERIVEGMKSFENNLKIYGDDKPSERLLDQACCGSLHKNNSFGCLEDTSYGSGSLANDTGLSDDWAPDFCKDRVSACDNAGKDSSAVAGLEVSELTKKLANYAAELKNNIRGMDEAFNKMPSQYRISSSKECSEELKPSQAKIGNPKCETTILTLAQSAAAIRAKNDQDPHAQAFLKNFEAFSARHKLMGTMPYVLLLTKDYKDSFTGKNAKSMNKLRDASDKMNVSYAGIKSSIHNFYAEVGGKAICSMKRLYSGRVKGNEDLNGLDDCTVGGDENRAIMAAILKNPGALEEVVYRGKVPEGLTLNSINSVACGIQRETKSCQDMWKSWEPYTKSLKYAATAAKWGLIPVAPYIAVPYFYAEQAIEVANAASELDKASIREDQMLASVLKDELDKEEFFVELNDREQKLTGAQLGMLMAIGGAVGDVYDVGKIAYVRVLGSKANELTLLKLLEKGDEAAISDFVKKNPSVKVEVSAKPFKPKPHNKKKKKKK